MNLMFVVALVWTTSSTNAAPTSSSCNAPIELISGDVEVPDMLDPNKKPHTEHRPIKVQFCQSGKGVTGQIPLERTAREIDGRRMFSEITARIYPDKSGVLITQFVSDLKPKNAEAALDRYTEFSRHDSSGKEMCRIRMKGMAPDAVSKTGGVAFAVKQSTDEAWWKSRHSTPYLPELGHKRIAAIDGACRTIYEQDLPADTPNQSTLVNTISDNGRWAAYLHGTVGAVFVDKIDLVNSTRKTLSAKFGSGKLDDSGRFYSQSTVMTMRIENGKAVKSSGNVIKYLKEEGDSLVPSKD